PQYMIILSGNLPYECAWYLLRLQTGLRCVGTGLMFFHFAVPFIVLLSRSVKQHARTLAMVAAGILVVRVVDLFWLIAPEFHTTGVSVSWMDVVLPIAMAALRTSAFIRQLRGRPLLPVHAPAFEDALARIIERGAPPRPAR